MRKNLVFGLIVTLVLSMTGPGALARAEEKKKAENAEKAEKEGVWRPFQIAIFNPVQIFNAKTTIKGFRLNLPYGRNKEVYGIDLGFVNRVDENFSSWQMGFVNLVGGRSSGLQMGLYNSSKELKGIQLGLLNTAREMKGLQLGLWVPWLLCCRGRGFNIQPSRLSWLKRYALHAWRTLFWPAQ